jgi:hypothetical protein
MKQHALRLIPALLLTLLFSTAALAQFVLPDHVYPVSQLKKAQEKAQASKKALAFVGTDKESTCALTTAASLELFQALKDSSIVVYVTFEELDEIPQAATQALDSSEAGEYIPKTVVLDWKAKKVLYLLPYLDSSSERQGRIQAMQEAISAFTKNNNF